MENAVKALEYGFAMLIFVIALTLSIYVFSQARETADAVFFYTDSRTLYDETELSSDEINANGRIVSIETIIPALYRDYKENYVIEFYTKDKESLILRFDLSEENRTRQLWTGRTNTDVKQRLDLMLKGSQNWGAGGGIINNQNYDINNDIAFNKDVPTNIKQIQTQIANKGLYEYCKGKRFVEEYAYVSKDLTIVTEEASKIVIRYVEF